MTTDEQNQNERVILLQRLTSQKDDLLKATQEIEELFYQYRVAGKSDPDGELEKEVWKRLHLMVAVLSELISYSNAGKDFTRNLILYLNQIERLGFIMDSGFTRMILMLANGIHIRWDIKKGPIVTFKDLSIFRNLFSNHPGT
jgi:hypothetical protein